MLPTPPPPRPARRDATIDLALRRFDGVPDSVEPHVASARPGWLGGLRKQPAGLLASVLIVVAIGVPATLIGLGDRTSEPIAEQDAASSIVLPGEATPPADEGAAEAAQTGASNAADVSSKARPVEPISVPSSPRREGFESQEPSPEPITQNVAAPSLAAPAPPPPAAPVPEEARQTANDATKAAERTDMIVTGSRRRSEAAAKGLSGPADVAIDRQPRSASAYLDRAIERQRRGDWRGALADLDRAHRLDPRDTAILRRRSEVHRHLGDIGRAKQDEARLRKLGSE